MAAETLVSSMLTISRDPVPAMRAKLTARFEPSTATKGLRKQVDNPEFQSLLMNDPAKAMPDVRQSILIVQGELDTQVAPSNADRLEELARKRKNAPPVQVVKVAGVNHLLVPSTTGEVEEYASLPDKHVSPAVIAAVVSWLRKTLATPAR